MSTMKFNNFLILFFIFNHTSYVVINLCLYLGLLQFCGLLLLVSRLLLFPIFFNFNFKPIIIFLHRFLCLEKEMETQSSVFAWRILWTEEPGGLLSMGSHRVGHDWRDLACMHALEKEMATHSSIPAWRTPGTEELGGLLSMGSHRVRHDWSDLAHPYHTVLIITAL